MEFDVKWTRPLTGLLDNRSSPDLMAPNALRARQNFNSPDPNKLSRFTGWRKLFDVEPYNNPDLHDQLLCLQTYYATNAPAPPDTPPVFDWPGKGPDPLFPAVTGCTTTQGALFSGYYWGINTDQNPNGLLTGPQIACSKALVDVLYQDMVDGDPGNTYTKGQYFWSPNATPGMRFSALYKWAANVCTPHDATGDHLISFDQSQCVGLTYCKTPVGQADSSADTLSSTPGDTSGVTVYPDNTGQCGTVLITRATGRQPFSLLFQAESSEGVRRLIAGTESRIYAVDQAIGNAKLIGDGYGLGLDNGTNPRVRFHATQNQDVVLFTNGYDDILSWLFDAATSGCDMQAVHPIPDLVNLGIRAANVIWTWQHVTFIADVTIDGTRYPNRIYWSDYNNPLSWDPGVLSSIAGFKDLEPGERILNGIEIDRYFMVFTDRRIWVMSVIGDVGNPFGFDKKYSPDKTGHQCLFYPNTLFSTGDKVGYLGRDGLYSFSVFQLAPDRVDWAHQGTKEMFDDIGEQYCTQHCAEFDVSLKSVLISWVSKNSITGLQEKTLMVDGIHKVVSTIDHGFTAFVNYQPDPRESLYESILRNCICTVAELNAQGYGLVKQGLPINAPPPQCPNFNGAIYSDRYITEDGAVVEDYTKPPHGNPLCSFFTFDDCTACALPSVFVGASAVDWCLKEFADVYYRERCTNPTTVCCGVPALLANGTTGPCNGANGYISFAGAYVLDGYDSILRSGAQGFGEPRFEKEISKFLAEIDAAVQTIPANVSLRVGWSSQAQDPNNPKCTIMWSNPIAKPLKCLSASAAIQAANNTRPNSHYVWKAFRKGYFLYWELTISGTGGACDISAIGQDIALRMDNRL